MTSLSDFHYNEDSIAEMNQTYNVCMQNDTKTCLVDEMRVGDLRVGEMRIYPPRNGILLAKVSYDSYVDAGTLS